MRSSPFAWRSRNPSAAVLSSSVTSHFNITDASRTTIAVRARRAGPQPNSRARATSWATSAHGQDHNGSVGAGMLNARRVTGRYRALSGEHLSFKAIIRWRAHRDKQALTPAGRLLSFMMRRAFEHRRKAPAGGFSFSALWQADRTSGGAGEAGGESERAKGKESQRPGTSRALVM